MKYYYEFGIEGFSLKSAIHEKTAAFVSKPYQIRGNATQVSLFATEEHPVLELNQSTLLSDRCTSVEYYVSNMDYPSIEQWMPILPTGQNMARNELLFFDSSRIATLNFRATTPNSYVYCNGQKLDSTEWTFISNCSKVSIIKNYDASSDYTIDYIPYGNPNNVDFADNINKTTEEVFYGTDRNMCVTLSNMPYINYSIINNSNDYNPNTNVYKPIQVWLEETDILGPGKIIVPNISPDPTEASVHTLNKTNYLEDLVSELRPYDLITYPIFEYLQDKDRIYFTESFNKANIRSNMPFNHGNAKIRIKYQYVSSSLRVKIVLRNNKFAYPQPVTPIVKDFSLRIKVIWT